MNYPLISEYIDAIKAAEDNEYSITVTNTHKPRIINTGDEAFNTAPYLAGMGVSGLLFLALALNGRRKKKKADGASGTRG